MINLRYRIKAAGEYVALLYHDDLLAEQALFWVAEAINRHPLASPAQTPQHA